jgi:hypothetical protein
VVLVVLVVPALLALAGCASSHHASIPGSAFAHSACQHWSKINAGISDITARRAESIAFERDADAAAAANARWRPLAQAAKEWRSAEGVTVDPNLLPNLQQAITDARAACAAVPK